jgi:hypothetical protein
MEVEKKVGKERERHVCVKKEREKRQRTRFFTQLIIQIEIVKVNANGNLI